MKNAETHLIGNMPISSFFGSSLLALIMALAAITILWGMTPGNIFASGAPYGKHAYILSIMLCAVLFWRLLNRNRYYHHGWLPSQK